VHRNDEFGRIQSPALLGIRKTPYATQGLIWQSGAFKDLLSNLAGEQSIHNTRLLEEGKELVRIVRLKRRNSDRRPTRTWGRALCRLWHGGIHIDMNTIESRDWAG
jgi:hypothetical protein